MARMLRESWRSDAPTSVEGARNRLVDAAEACFTRFGVAKTTLEDIATEAGVSRATVYRYFEGGRDEVILGVVLREGKEFLETLSRRVQREETFEAAIVEGVLHTVGAVSKNEHLALLFAPEVAGHTTSIAGASTALYELAQDFLRPIFEQARVVGQLRDGIIAEDAAEFVLRMILSLLSVAGPRQRSQAKEREFLATYCAGALVRS
ncbi:MAG TPA: TetR/AcrR family transcriptional regulator [Acidimicrobiales bacterium]|nr:TetR/AcrR family transcriptional regulator [Acidimicrobiales bacterium]